MDIDKDGRISKAEMLAAVLDTAFSMFDKNHDGRLEFCEVCGCAELAWWSAGPH